jgi:hypothetical protein
MKTNANSNLFQNLYNESCPIGSLGRGAHYSILRALIWHDTSGKSLQKPMYYDFAILWDEDHDTRIVEVIEEIYYNGLLRHFAMFGERKGMFSAVLNSKNNIFTGGQCDELHNQLTKISEDSGTGDIWSATIMSDIYNAANNGIIADRVEIVQAYLNNINVLWDLGEKNIKHSSQASLDWG